MIDEKKLIKDLEETVRVSVKSGDCTARKLLGLFMVVITNQPKVGEWVPCHKELPEKHVAVLIQWEKNYWAENRTEIYLNIGFIDEDGEWVSANGYGTYNGQVMAWQPLPEPWKGAEEWNYEK